MYVVKSATIDGPSKPFEDNLSFQSASQCSTHILAFAAASRDFGESGSKGVPQASQYLPPSTSFLQCWAIHRSPLRSMCQKITCHVIRVGLSPNREFEALRVKLRQ